MKFHFKKISILLITLIYFNLNITYGQESYGQPSLHLALKEYQIFHAKGVREEKVRLFCNQYNVLQRRELWPHEKEKKNYLNVGGLAALSYEGDLLIVFNPQTSTLESYDITSQTFQRKYTLPLKSDKFIDMIPVAPGYIIYKTSSSHLKTIGTVSYSNTKCLLFILSLVDGKIVQLSDNQSMHSDLGRIQGAGWNSLMSHTDENGNLYIHSASEASEDTTQIFPNNVQKTRVWCYNIASGKKDFLYTLPYHLTELIFTPTGHISFAISEINKNQNYFEIDRKLRFTSVFSTTKEGAADLKGFFVFPHHKTMILLDRRFTDKRIPILFQWGSGAPVYTNLLNPDQIRQLKGDVNFALTNPEQPDQLLYLGTKYNEVHIDVYGDDNTVRLDQLIKQGNTSIKRIGLLPSPHFKRVGIISGSLGQKSGKELIVYDMDRIQKTISPIFSHILNVRRICDQKFSKPMLVDIPTQDGIFMPGYLTLPNGFSKDNYPTNLPVFMYVHGGPHKRDKLEFNPLVQFLASRRMAVLQVNYPGSTGFGKAYEYASDGHWDKVIEYLHDARDWLISEKIADPEKIAIGGTSFGAYATVASLQRYPFDYQCGIAVNGIYNLPLELKRESQPGNNSFNFARQFSGTVGHLTPQTIQFLENISPALNAAKIYTPLLLLHATQDTICPLEQVESLVKNHPELRIMYGHFKGDEHNLKREHLAIEGALTEWFLSQRLGTFSEPLGDVLDLPTFKWQKVTF